MPQPTNTPGRQLSAASPAAAARPVSAPKPKAAPKPKPKPKGKPKPAANPAIASAAQRHTGAFAGALNNLSGLEQRQRDVAARRQADADKYAAFVMGQQGKLAAAAQAADDKALGQSAAIQGATASYQQNIQAQLQQQRDAQGGAGVGGAPDGPRTNAGAGSGMGVGPGAGLAAQSTSGAVPAQQLAPVADAQKRTQSLLAAGGQQQAAQANTNRGKAGFLAAAAQATLLANRRAIAGDEFEQVSAINREKTGILARKSEVAISDRQNREAAAASAAQAAMEANARAQESAADRASREAIAGETLGARRDIAAAQLSNAATQGRANRRASLKASRDRGKGRGSAGVSHSESRIRGEASRAYANMAESAAATARSLRSGRYGPDGKPSPRGKPMSHAERRATLAAQYPELGNVGVQWALYSDLPGTSGGKAARKAYRKRLAEIKSGK